MRALYCYSTHVSDNSIDTHNQIILRGGRGGICRGQNLAGFYRPTLLVYRIDYLATIYYRVMATPSQEET